MKSSPLSDLSRELAVLSQAVPFPNLSGAAQQIGISQPQLSRIVARLEKNLGVVLLNREVRRRATWMPIAHELAQTYSRGARHLEAEMKRLIEDAPLRQLRIGTLEGLIPVAAELGHRLIPKLGLETLELDVLDLSELEERFLRGDFDLVLTMREPGRRKYSYSRNLGYQVLEEKNRPSRGDSARIQSGYEFRSGQRAARGRPSDSEEGSATVISNSLSLRRHWLETFGGSGQFPSPLHSRSSGAKSEAPVLLLGAESLGTRIWKLIAH